MHVQNWFHCCGAQRIITGWCIDVEQRLLKIVQLGCRSFSHQPTGRDEARREIFDGERARDDFCMDLFLQLCGVAVLVDEQKFEIGGTSDVV